MSAPISKSEQRWAIAVAAAVVAASCLPYLAAWLLTPDGTHYTGLLINHYDGNSYYAKMQQGARGDWLFHLPFTPEPHQGAFIFTFYLALGHVADAVHLPIPLVYHIARALTGFLLLIVAYHFIARFFTRIASRRYAFLLLALSAGLGWLMAPLGAITADVWVAEGFTFLSILANPHFPLAIGLMLVLFMAVLDVAVGAERVLFRWLRAAQVAAIAAVLAIVQPFAVPVVLAVLGVYLGLLIYQRRSLVWGPLLYSGVVALGAAPVMIYDLYVYTANPALAAWGAQNVTPSLPPWSYLLGYGLILLLALPSMVIACRRREPGDLFLLAWVATAAVLLYVPFSLQRRFITGLHVPLALLAAIGLERVVMPRLTRRWRGPATGAILAATALTSVFVPLVPVVAVAQAQPPLVISEAQAEALGWLGEHSAWTDTVLAPPDMAYLVPAWAGNRVVYGHPFETIDADEKREAVERFYAPATPAAERAAILAQFSVHYVLVTDGAPLPTLPTDPELAWTDRSISIYKVSSTP